MAYQPFSIVGGSGGMSYLNATPTRSGSIACTNGTAWVRLKHTATVTASGNNNTISSPANDGMIDGWVRLEDGDTFEFGVERVHETAQSDLIAQIDFFCEQCNVTCIQH